MAVATLLFSAGLVWVVFAQPETTFEPQVAPTALPEAAATPVATLGSTAFTSVVEATPPTLATSEPTATPLTAAPAPTRGAVAQAASDEARLDALQNQLTDEQKVGQLLMLGFGGTTAEEAAYLIRTYHPGSIVFWQNTKTPLQTQTLTHDLQALATSSGAGIPLFIAVDHEGGQVQRLTQGVTYFPSKRVLGATRDPALARLEGEVEGGELRALGITMNLGPVLDVDSNLDNPIIGRFERSLSSDPATVADLGVAYIQGLQSQGVLAVGKHFPGHGATVADSHVALPRLPLTVDDLNGRELVPFRAAADARVAAMMTAHLMLPNVDPDWPSSLSSVFIQNLLRGSAGYDGLVMTDDMGGMAAITDNYTAGGAAVRAIVAGNDLAMIVGDAAREAQAFSAVNRAVASGEIPRDQFEASVRRVLRAKLQYGLLDAAAVLAPMDLPQPNATALQQIADGAITLIRDGGRDPVVSSVARRALVISPGTLPASTSGGTQLGAAVRSRVPLTTELMFQLSGDNTQVLRDALARAHVSDVVIVGTTNAGPWQQSLVRQLAQIGTPLVVGFGAPDEVANLPPEVAYYAAYVPRAEYVQAAVKVLFGEEPAAGHLPIGVGPYAAGWSAADQPARISRGGR